MKSYIHARDIWFNINFGRSDQCSFYSVFLLLYYANIEKLRLKERNLLRDVYVIYVMYDLCIFLY